MSDAVEITFACLPLRSIGRLDIPLDASPKFQERCHRIQAAMAKHGSHNSYYLYDARAEFRLTNNPDRGLLGFAFEGVVLTDPTDANAMTVDVAVELTRETCDWLRQPIVDWFRETVAQAVKDEFDLYIRSGDLEKAKTRIAALQSQADQAGGYLGMYL
ncbi:MAG: hypothetical protein QM811_01790 [Pirellulales bacterium]